MCIVCIATIIREQREFLGEFDVGHLDITVDSHADVILCGVLSAVFESADALVVYEDLKVVHQHPEVVPGLQLVFLIQSRETYPHRHRTNRTLNMCTSRNTSFPFNAEMSHNVTNIYDSRILSSKKVKGTK